MLTPAAVESPTPEKIRLYRAAAVAYRKAWRELRRNDGDRKLINWHIPLQAAAVAVQQLAPEKPLDQARTFAQKALAWTAQALTLGWRG